MDMGQENSGRGPTYRAALIAVIILSSLFVAGVVALIIGFMRQYQIYQAGSRSGVNMGAGAPPAVKLICRRGVRTSVSGPGTRSSGLAPATASPNPSGRREQTYLWRRVK